MNISIIAAAGLNNVIGKDNELPWHIPEDLKMFRLLTLGQSVIMGRKTFESIGNEPLAGRRNIILSSGASLYEGCAKFYNVDAGDVIRFARGIPEALNIAGDAEVFVIGGGSVYKQFLPLADKVYLTRVNITPEGDVHFPELREEDWRIVNRQDFEADESRQYGYSYFILERRARGVN